MRGDLRRRRCSRKPWPRDASRRSGGSGSPSAPGGKKTVPTAAAQRRKVPTTAAAERREVLDPDRDRMCDKNDPDYHSVRNPG
jgi:hypothetical protein